MSFNIDFNKPAITNAQASQDGGAGNLGYMKGGGQGKNKNQQEANSIFDLEKSDSFTKSDSQNEETFSGFLDRIILTFKLIFKKIFKF